MIYGNTVGGSGGGFGKTFIIQDAAGNELVGVVVDKQVVFDATANDIRLGKVAATQNGVTTGEKEIPIYNTNAGSKVIDNGSKFVLYMKNYDYTNFQAIVCLFNTSLSNSVAAEKVVIDNNVYPVKSTVADAAVTKNDDLTQIDFGITNNTGSPCLIRYVMYKEIY